MHVHGGDGFRNFLQLDRKSTFPKEEASSLSSVEVDGQGREEMNENLSQKREEEPPLSLPIPLLHPHLTVSVPCLPPCVFGRIEAKSQRNREGREEKERRRRFKSQPQPGGRVMNG
mmetsp:Transcript_53005/g.103687  ORF Transcript_53005/g.103687 Transcript_53005/m.103687 type:complete len:116 (+) Transcript_53005:176-523(+)